MNCVMCVSVIFLPIIACESNRRSRKEMKALMHKFIHDIPYFVGGPSVLPHFAGACARPTFCLRSELVINNLA